MAIIKHQSDRILPDGLNRRDPNILFADHQRFLPRTMPFDLGGGRVYPQKFEGQLIALGIAKGHFQ